MSIQEHLNKIRTAIKGSEVRESIAKGIETAYDDASEKDNANMEVKMARGTNPNLNTRLNKMGEMDIQNTERIYSNHNQVTAQLAQKASKQEVEVERLRINSLSQLEEGSTTGDAELIDIRIGADGTVYETAGEAVRNVLTAYMTTADKEWVI